MKLNIKQQLFYFFPVLLCFCLPFGSLVLSAIVVAWSLFSLVNINKSEVIKGIKNINFWALLVFFTYTAASALFSKNKQEASFNVEVKMSFLLFPFFFFCFSWPIQLIKRCLVSFVSGCFFAGILLLIRSTYYALNGHPEYFFYTQYSNFIHASYFAMYLILAIAIIFLFYPKWFQSQKSVVYASYFFIVILTVSIFLCSSKLGIISFFICVPLLFIYKLRAILNLKKISYLMLGLFILIIITFKLFPETFNRLSSLKVVSSTSSIDKTSSESTSVRILIWEQCIQLMKENFWFGTTVGDANDRLYQSYKENGLTGALSHHLNAHNQYFQTFIGLGFFGFIILLFLTFGYLIKNIFNKHFLFILFSILIILNFLVESMLQTSAGVLFFCFFFCLFNKASTKDLLNEN